MDVMNTPTHVEETKKPERNWKRWLWVAAIALALGLWWTKTKTWPVVAIVAGKPLTRFEIDQALYKQSGEGMVDSLVTQRLVEAELDSRGIKVDQGAVDARIEEMRTTVPEGKTLEEELESRGYTLDQVKKLVGLQLRINKAVESTASVSAEELEKYVKDNEKYLTGKTMDEKKKEAEGILKQDKLAAAIDTWISDVKTKGQVWRFPL